MVRVKNLDESLDFYCNKLGMVETRRTESEKGRYTNLFLAASEDKANAEASKAPVLELTYNWDPEDYTGRTQFRSPGFRSRRYLSTLRRPPSLWRHHQPAAARRCYLAFIRSPDGISIELLQKGGAKEAAEPWQSDGEHRQLVGRVKPAAVPAFCLSSEYSSPKVRLQDGLFGTR